MASKLVTRTLDKGFPKAMVKLLDYIHTSVRNAVRALRGQGAEVREKMQILVQKYMDLIGDCLQECVHFENVAHISKTKLGNVEDILKIVLSGKVRDMLTSLNLEKYQDDFDKNDLEDIYQLMRDSQQLEQLQQLSEPARKKIQGKIQYYRDELMTIKQHIQDVKKEGKSCHQSSQKITKKFSDFLDEMKNTMEGIITLLDGKLNKKETYTLANDILSGAMAAGGAVVCLTGVVGLGINYFMPPTMTPLPVPSLPTTGCAAFIAAKGSTTYQEVSKQEEEVAKIAKAIEKLQKKLETMYNKGSKQKMAWRQIETQAEKVVHYITTSRMTRAAERLKPSQHGPEQELLRGVQYVSQDFEKLATNVSDFKTGAEKVQKSLRGMSLMKRAKVGEALPKPAGEALPKPADVADPSLSQLNDIINELMREMTTDDADDM